MLVMVMDLNKIVSVATLIQLGKENAKKETSNFKTQEWIARDANPSRIFKTQCLEIKSGYFPCKLFLNYSRI